MSVWPLVPVPVPTLVAMAERAMRAHVVESSMEADDPRYTVAQVRLATWVSALAMVLSSTEEGRRRMRTEILSGIENVDCCDPVTLISDLISMEEQS